MKRKNEEFPKYACQFSGREHKLVETLIDDEFIWNEVEQMYQPNKFTDMFKHTGKRYCTECAEDRTRL